MREFRVQLTHADGAPDGEAELLSFQDARARLALRWPRGEPLTRLDHHFALSRAAPGHPVDVVVFQGEGIAFSARIEYVSHGTQAPQILAA